MSRCRSQRPRRPSSRRSPSAVRGAVRGARCGSGSPGRFRPSGRPRQRMSNWSWTSGSRRGRPVSRRRAWSGRPTGRSSRRSSPTTLMFGSASLPASPSSCSSKRRPTRMSAPTGPFGPPWSAASPPRRRSRSTRSGEWMSCIATARCGSWCRTSPRRGSSPRFSPRPPRAGQLCSLRWRMRWRPSIRSRSRAPHPVAARRSPGCWPRPRRRPPTGCSPLGTPTSTRRGCGRCARRSASARGRSRMCSI